MQRSLVAVEQSRNRALTATERKRLLSTGNGSADAQFRGLKAEGILSSRRHAKQQRGDAAQQSRLPRLVVAVEQVEIRISGGKLDLAIGEVPEAKQIEAIDSHT